MSIDIAIHDPVASKKAPSKPRNNSDYQSIDYGSLRNLKALSQQPLLLAGLGKKGARLSMQRGTSQHFMIEEPKLLSTAKQHFKNIHDQSLQSQDQPSFQLGASSFLNSRQVTPANPLLSAYGKKKNPSNRNKVNSMASELFSIPSNPQNAQDKTSRFKNPEFRLYDCILGQSQLVYKYVFGKSRIVNPKVIHMWKDCLSHEDKSEIYLPVGDQSVQIPYSNARIYPLDKIEKEFKIIYGTGKSRALTAGQEAVIIESSRRYLNLCVKEPLKITRKDYDILQDILRDCKLSELQNYPYCMKQGETHFKLQATKWKYSGLLDHKDKIVETGLIMGKNNFLDLTKHNILTQFLLNNSNVADFD